MSTRSVVVHPDAALLAKATAARLLTAVLDRQSTAPRVDLCLTGGTVGIRTLAEVAQDPVHEAVDWTGVHLWWGDERFLADGDGDRNETQARAALLRDLPVPAENIHPIPARSSSVPDPETSAALYADELAAHAPDGSSVPEFDVLLLGMGPDAHVASLFPGHPELSASGFTAPVHGSPKPPSERVTLTYATIRSARQVWVVAAGAEKADAVASSLRGDDVTVAPASGAYGTERTLWLLDAAAAGSA
ncbi:6-phosphogluconolactonase [Paraoerskovia marina]|uniref:6-phosphogluconolactonase n=1 Tax=Paraoerskovia marina TaxID=545619 RepID=A0A1H1T3A3_9CELL|nr:6-phosphogluconolactonase [Paraoerskovia marina]SDS54660.1 6-phosphogluconolactonase [Paraoerskovia marina]